MSYADDLFIKMCQDILANGTNTMGEKVRPHWADGTPAYTIKQFGVVNRYDLRKEFPALTLRKTYIKSAVDEILWIYQKKSNNIHDLKSHIWDEWADKDGSIGKAYGYQIGETFVHHGEKSDSYTFYDNIPNHKELYPSAWVEHNNDDDMPDYVVMDQMDAVLYDLKNNPYSRRIMTNIYNHKDLHEMRLQPCCWSLTFNVTQRQGEDKLTLNMILNQRSQDILAANNWNVVQYAVLQHMIAQVCDMNIGELVHVIADAHIYDRHVPIIQELIKRPTYPAPKFSLNPDVKNFYDFTPDDVIIENYEAGEQVKDIPIAI